MTVYTRYLHLPIPDFAVKPWHSLMADALNLIDASLYNAIIQQNTTIWDNDVAYELGEFAIDPDDGNFYVNLVEHTSSTTGTFADERTAHPTYWSPITTQFESQGQWQTATQYLVNNFVIHNDAFYICRITHTSGVFADDLAAGRWDLLFDASGYLTDQNVFEAQVFS